MIKLFILIVFGVGVFINDVYCQDRRIVDSLQLVLRTKAGGDRYPALHKLAVQYVDMDNERALSIARESEAAALLTEDTFSIVKSKRLKGQILFRLARNPEVVSTYESVLPFAQSGKFVEEWVLILNNLGISYLYESRFDKALQYLFQAHEISKKENNLSWIGMSLTNIGITYYKLKDYKKALQFFESGLAAKRSIKDSSIFALLNISLCYVQLNDFNKAQKYLQEVLKICGPGCSDQNMVHIKYATASIFFGLTRYNKAENECLESYTYAKKTGDSRMQLDNICLLSEIYIKQDLIDKALHYLNQGEQLMQKGLPFNLEMINIYSHFSRLYVMTRNFKKASFYQFKYMELKDSIYNEALTNGLMKTESEYLERENKAKISAQAEVIFLKEKMIDHQMILNVITGLLVLVTLSFSIFLFYNFRRKQNLNILLDRKVRERTLELELSRDELLKALREMNLRVNRASGFITDSINTIEGLCFTARKEISDPVTHSYLGRIIKISGDIAGNVQKVFGDALPLPSA